MQPLIARSILSALPRLAAALALPTAMLAPLAASAGLDCRTFAPGSVQEYFVRSTTSVIGNTRCTELDPTPAFLTFRGDATYLASEIGSQTLAISDRAHVEVVGDMNRRATTVIAPEGVSVTGPDSLLSMRGAQVQFPAATINTALLEVSDGAAAEFESLDYYQHPAKTAVRGFGSQLDFFGSQSYLGSLLITESGAATLHGSSRDYGGATYAKSVDVIGEGSVLRGAPIGPLPELYVDSLTVTQGGSIENTLSVYVAKTVFLSDSTVAFQHLNLQSGTAERSSIEATAVHIGSFSGEITQFLLDDASSLTARELSVNPGTEVTLRSASTITAGTTRLYSSTDLPSRFSFEGPDTLLNTSRLDLIGPSEFTVRGATLQARSILVGDDGFNYPEPLGPLLSLSDTSLSPESIWLYRGDVVVGADASLEAANLSIGQAGTAYVEDPHLRVADGGSASFQRTFIHHGSIEVEHNGSLSLGDVRMKNGVIRLDTGEFLHVSDLHVDGRTDSSAAVEIDGGVFEADQLSVGVGDLRFRSGVLRMGTALVPQDLYIGSFPDGPPPGTVIGPYSEALLVPAESTLDVIGNVIEGTDVGPTALLTIDNLALLRSKNGWMAPTPNSSAIALVFGTWETGSLLVGVDPTGVGPGGNGSVLLSGAGRPGVVKADNVQIGATSEFELADQGTLDARVVDLEGKFRMNVRGDRADVDYFFLDGPGAELTVNGGVLHAGGVDPEWGAYGGVFGSGGSISVGTTLGQGGLLDANYITLDGTNVYVDPFGKVQTPLLDLFGGDSEFVIDGTMDAQKVNVYGGRLDVNGTLFTDQVTVYGGALIGVGNLRARSVTAIGGIQLDLYPEDVEDPLLNIGRAVVSPGHSPGVLEIDGDLTLQGDVEVLMELAGSDPAARDRLVIGGNLEIAGILSLSFLDGYAPKEGDVFDLFAVAGTTTGDFEDVQVSGLQPGWEFALAWDGGVFQLFSQSNALPVPEPSTGLLVAAGFGFFAARSRSRQTRT